MPSVRTVLRWRETTDGRFRQISAKHWLDTERMVLKTESNVDAWIERHPTVGIVSLEAAEETDACDAGR